MIETIADIRENLRQGRYINEASVSQGIVLRILNDLGWPTFDTSVVSPEFRLGGTRADFALCHPPRKPLVLLEVKQVGLGNDAEHQLFGYAVHHGVPMAILTTGQEWHFFLPGERGDYGERRVYMVDLLEREPEECVVRLNRYLAYQDVRSGKALEAARADYLDLAKEREIRKTLPEAWSKLIQEGDEILLELVAEKVESLCGYKPSTTIVANFLVATDKHPLSKPFEPSRSMRVGEIPKTDSTSQPPQEVGVDRRGFVFQGTFYSAKHKRDVLLGILRLMAERDPGFPDRLADRTKSERSRRHIARSKLDLYPSSPKLADNPAGSRELMPGSGWWVDVHKPQPSMEKFVRFACEVAGLTYGKDVKALFD